MNLITKKGEVDTEGFEVLVFEKTKQHKEKWQDKPLEKKNAQNTILQARVKSSCTLTAFWDKYNVI